MNRARGPHSENYIVPERGHIVSKHIAENYATDSSKWNHQTEIIESASNDATLSIEKRNCNQVEKV